MTTVADTVEIEGFTVHTLQNEHCAISVVPELGGRIVSLLDKSSGREWMDGWQPAGDRRLWHPSDPSDFNTSPLAGADECLPTVLPSNINGVEIPDHGDLWTSQAEVDEEKLTLGDLSLSWTLRSLPLHFTRTIRVSNNTIQLRYRLENLATRSVPFLWAWHPLFTIEEGDQIHFTDQLKHCQTPEGQSQLWPEAISGQNLATADLGNASPPCSKVFLGPLTHGHAEIRSRRSSLTLDWPTEHFPWAGIWISRGFSHGHNHWAIEPTNAPVDRLNEAISTPSPTSLLDREVKNWDLIIRLE